jgi:hypothetical protein
MTIATLDQYIAAAKQKVPWTKTAARTTVANGWFSLLDLAGQPGAGTLAGASTTAGVVPDDTVAGYPPINSFGGGAVGALTRVEFANTVACRIAVFDRLFLAGAYAFNAATSLTGQPSFLGREPNGNGLDCELWIEAVTAFTGNPSIAVTYTNQAGTAARTTGTVATGLAPTLGRCIQLPLQAGDAGIQKVESVTATVATVGTFNVMVLRPLWSARVTLANMGDVHDLIRSGMPRVYDTSALYVMINADSTSSGVPELSFQVANG